MTNAINTVLLIYDMVCTLLKQSDFLGLFQIYIHAVFSPRNIAI